jgi:DNA-binding CsgD family transcriptional regulator
MMEALKLILLLATVIAGAIAIFFSFQLTKRYQLPFVSSYFYYLVFLYIFGIYSLVGSGLLEHIFARMEIEEKTTRGTILVLILLGIPFLALSKYMLLKTVLEYLHRKIHPLFTTLYFMAGVAVLVLYGVFVVRFTRFDHGDYERLVSVQQWIFTGFLASVYIAVYILAVARNGKLTGQHDKRFIRMFGARYLLYMALCCAAFLCRLQHWILPFIFIFLFLSWHLIPILFLNLFLEKHHAPTAILQDDFETRLDVFSRKYEISSREREVVRLICKGWSNREISETLFISLQTVKDHTHHIFVKTGVRNRVQLANLIRSE